MSFFSIAIDGPAGAGKSTIAKKVAKKLSYIYVDTGAMYRALALYFITNDIESFEQDKIEEACQDIDVLIEYKDDEQIVLLNGKNVNHLIRTEEVGKIASAISVYKKVRLKLVELQQNLAKQSNVVMDGRDIGTYVLPKANLKIYLTASAKERARRRWAQLKEKGIDSDINMIEEDINERDKQDMTREFAPLKQADDAIYLDSSNLTIDEVVQKILTYYQEIKSEL